MVKRARAKNPSTKHRKEPDPTAKTIGARIKRLRKEDDFNFDAFVEETGLGRGYISELERGLVVPTVVSLEKVAVALRLTVADLVLGDSDREKLMAVTRHLGKKQVYELLKTAQKMAGVEEQNDSPDTYGDT
jgi:XRE family transcriptional regulator, regulator of sulfur utilization